MYVHSLGCPKNEVDSRAICRHLARRGMVPVDSPDKADAIVINTCGFIQDAKEESLEAVFAAARAWPRSRLVVVGCLVERYREDLVREIPEVEAWFGVEEAEAVARYLAGTAPRDVQADGNACLPSGAWAYIKVSDGCDHACSFCAIPLIKGPYHALSVAAIQEQAEDALAHGARELVLVGQDTALWRDGAFGLPDLVQLLAGDPRVKWVRMMYLQPEHVDQGLMSLIAAHPSVCRYLDMPFQHASRPVLQRMRRLGDVREYLEKIAQARGLMPDVSLRSTFIVGFPGESEDDFQTLLDFAGQAGFDHAGAFTYSSEEGTEAAGLRPRVSPGVAKRRLNRLTGLLLDIAEERNILRVGGKATVMVDGPAGADMPEGAVAVGRTQGQAPEVDGVTYLVGNGSRSPSRGDVVQTVVIDAMGYDLVAEIISDESS